MSCPVRTDTHCATKMLLAQCCPDLTMVVLAVAETFTQPYRGLKSVSQKVCLHPNTDACECDCTYRVSVDIRILKYPGLEWALFPMICVFVTKRKI